MNFQSDMSETEYEREGFAIIEKPLPNDVIIEQQKIQQSDCIVFIYPVWWSDCPAKLKGWFDRVYSVGYAYGYDQAGNKQIKMKKQKLGLVLCTAEEIGIAESMRKVMIEDRLGQRFTNKQMVIFGGTLEIEKVKEKHLINAFEIGKNIENYCLEE
jgi:NAD(P)H dehydrogenase (quinone)